MRAVGGPLSDTITYEYGPKGRRLAKVSLLEGRTEYLYEGDEPIADYMITGAGNDRLLRRFVNGAAIELEESRHLLRQLHEQSRDLQTRKVECCH